MNDKIVSSVYSLINKQTNSLVENVKEFIFNVLNNLNNGTTDFTAIFDIDELKELNMVFHDYDGEMWYLVGLSLHSSTKYGIGKNHFFIRVTDKYYYTNMKVIDLSLQDFDNIQLLKLVQYLELAKEKYNS